MLKEIRELQHPKESKVQQVLHLLVEVEIKGLPVLKEQKVLKVIHLRVRLVIRDLSVLRQKESKVSREMLVNKGQVVM